MSSRPVAPRCVGGLGGFGGAFAIPAGYREPLLVASTRRRRDRRRPSRTRSDGSTRSASTSSRCAPTTSCAPAPSRWRSSTTSRSAGSIRSPWPSWSVGWRPAAARRAARLVGGETAEHPGPDGRRRLRPGRVLRSASSSARGSSTGRPSGPATRSWAWPRRACTRTATRWSGRSWRQLGPGPRRAVPGPTPPDDGRRATAVAADRGHRSEAMATLGEVLLTPTRIYARAHPGASCGARRRRPRPPRSRAHHRWRPARQRRRARCRTGLAARLDPSRWAMPSVMRLFGALGGLDDVELRATFNGGLGMIAVVPAAGGRPRHRRASRARDHRDPRR